MSPLQINNAGIGGTLLDDDAFRASSVAAGGVSPISSTPYDKLLVHCGIEGFFFCWDDFLKPFWFSVWKQTAGAEAKINWREILTENYELALACLQTNYYGAKLTTEALLPLLHLSTSPTIVNVASASGKLKVLV